MSGLVLTYRRFLNLFPAAPSPYGIVYAVLCVAITVLPLFNTKAIVPVAIAGGLAIIIMARKTMIQNILRQTDPLLGAALAAYFLAVFVSTLLGDSFSDAVISLGKLLGLVILAAALIPFHAKLTESDIRWLSLALIAGLLFSTLWIGMFLLSEYMRHAQGQNLTAIEKDYFERIGYYGYFWYKAATTVIAVASLAAGIYLQRLGKPLLAIILVISAVLVCHWVGSRSAGYGLIAALTAGIVYHLLGKRRLGLTLAVLCLSFLMPVWITVSDIKPEQVTQYLDRSRSGANSVVYRLHIWDYVNGKINEKPVFGWGAGSSRRLGNDKAGKLSDPKFGPLGEPIPIHPHNAVMQVWLESGFFGAFFTLMLLARGLAVADRHIRAPGQRIWAFATGTMIACLFGFNFSISSSWWIAVVIVIIATATAFVRPAHAPAASSET